MDVQLMPGPRENRKPAGPSLPRQVGLLFKDAGKGWVDDGASNLAAALSFYTLFSISPLLVVAIAVAGLLYGEAAATGEALARMEAMMGPQAAAAVQTILANTADRGAGIVATVAGLVGVLLGATGVFGHLQRALNRMWKVRPRPGQGVMAMVRARLAAFCLVVVVGFLLLLSLAAATALSALGETLAGYLPFSSFALQAFNFGVALLVTAAGFAILFKVLPDGAIRWRDLWVGALGTAVLFSVGRWLIGLYLAHGSASSAYGAAGSMVLLLLWIYYSAQVLFFGAELTRAYAERFGEGVVPKRNAEKAPVGS